MDLLILLAERRGQLVSREDIVVRLWGPGVFVDVDTGINTAVRKLRTAFEDSADNPRFIETVPRRGYRFIAVIKESADDVPTLEAAGKVLRQNDAAVHTELVRDPSRTFAIIAVAAAMLLL